MSANRQSLGTAGPVLADQPADQAAGQHEDNLCLACVSPDEHDDWNAQARGETPLQRADRAYGEILQEVRVAQTGVQILFAFLLTLAFTSRFGAITTFQKQVYVVTLMLSAGAAALLIAPAAFHRMVYRRRLKQQLVHAANRLALAGLALLLLAMVSALLLILDVVIGRGPAMILATAALSWFITWWFVLPIWQRLRHRSHLHLVRPPAARRGLSAGGRSPASPPAGDGYPGHRGPGETPAPFTGPDAAGVTPMPGK